MHLLEIDEIIKKRNREKKEFKIKHWYQFETL